MSCDWENDCQLEQDLQKYVRQSLQRGEILDYVRRDYPNYNWSLRTLDRRLRHFEIYYHDRNVSENTVREAVQKEMDGAGKLLGYRALHLKIRQKYELCIPRDVVYNILTDEYKDILEERRPGIKKKKRKTNFVTKGPDWVFSLDGHDKLMGYQNSTFPLAVYGCMDTASRKILFLRIWHTNSSPEVIGKWYFEYLSESRIIPNYIRMDKGTETSLMATMHCFVRENHGDMDDATDAVIFGPSTSNQIERWWRELHERLEKFFKVGLSWLLEEKHYHRNSQDDRDKLAFVMIPLIQEKLDEFKDIIWNPHRIRYQKNTLMADGIPNHIYDFPEKYGLEQCGFVVTEEDIQRIANESGVLDQSNDFLDINFKQACEQILVEEITDKNYVQSYLDLKYKM